MADQQRFAALSGDHNPIHLDPLASRRTALGSPIIHGVHGVLWALEKYCGVELPSVVRLDVSFPGPIYVGDEVLARAVKRSQDEVRITLTTGNAIATVITVQSGRGAELRLLDAIGEKVARPSGASIVTPVELVFEQVADLSGWLAPNAEVAAVSQAFPALSGVVSAERLNGIVLLSRLVGMVCPGLHSIFQGFAIDIVEPIDALLGYFVKEIDDRFRLVRMAVEGCGLRGDVTAFMRVPPVAQPSMAQIKTMVQEGSFLGADVLVVGGTRGLGEVTAKACAAGGARVVITYATGMDDAERVSFDIRRHGGICDILSLDVRGDIPTQLAALHRSPTHLYYFATGAIAKRRTEFFSSTVLAEFVMFYATGFLRVCEALLEVKGHDLRALYPSSTAIDEAPKGWTEYAMAKVAGEVLCNAINTRLPGVTVVVRRLPRILTDQTASLLAVGTAEILSILLPIIDEIQRNQNDG